MHIGLVEHMVINKLDAEGLPAAHVEQTLAHHLLGRPNPLARHVVYALIGGPRRNSELAPGGRSDNNLTQVLKLLRDEGIVWTVTDARTRPAQTAYALSPLGFLVVDWMRRFEFLAEMRSGADARQVPVA